MTPLLAIVLAGTLQGELDAKGHALCSKHPCTRPQDMKYDSSDLATELRLTAAKGEYEPVTLAVFAGRELKGARVETSELRGPNGNAIPRSAVEMRTQVGQTTGEGQARVGRQLLYANRRADVKPGGYARFWITIKVPEDAAAGEYRGTVSVEGAGVEASLPIVLRVRPFALGRLKGRHAIMIGNPSGDAYVSDMYEHMMTVVCDGCDSHIQESPDGDVVLPTLEQKLEQAKRFGLGEFYIAYAGGIGRTSKVKNSGHILEHHPYVHPLRVLKAAVAYRKKCRENDWPEVIWYIFDEPGRGDRKQFGPLRNRICRGMYAKTAELPGVRTFLTAGRDDAREFGRNYDLHCYGGAPKPEDVEHSRLSGALVMRYSNGISMGTNPIRSRFGMGFFPWRCDYDGSTSWTYPIERDQIGEDGKPIPPVVWEAIREGVEDWRYLQLLEDALAANPNSTHAAAARAFLDALRAEIDPNKEACPWDGPAFDDRREKAASFIEKLAAR